VSPFASARHCKRQRSSKLKRASDVRAEETSYAEAKSDHDEESTAALLRDKVGPQA